MSTKSRNMLLVETSVTRRRHGKHHGSVATVMDSAMEELWEAVFSVASVQSLYLEN
jgi:hypothetical protein